MLMISFLTAQTFRVGIIQHSIYDKIERPQNTVRSYYKPHVINKTAL